MMNEMTSMQRVGTALSHKEADRVPLFLLFSFYGARELNMSIEEYFQNPENIVTAQLKLKEKYSNDCLYSFFYAAVEMEAFGGKTIFHKEAPPVAGKPVINNVEDIKNLEVPDVYDSPSLKKVLTTIKMLKEQSNGDTPVISVVMSPFSLPIMQMGFEKYLDLLINDKENFELLIKKNEEFCISWANAQLDAGATFIVYFDPMSSTTIIPKDLFMTTGYEISKRIFPRINGPIVTHFASGRSYSIVDEVIDTGASGIVASFDDDFGLIKEKTKGKITLAGNLNLISMLNSSDKEIEKNIRDLIQIAASDGGFIITDAHGEIPWQVPERVLLEISENIKKWGSYPIKG